MIDIVQTFDEQTFDDAPVVERRTQKEAVGMSTMTWDGPIAAGARAPQRSSARVPVGARRPGTLRLTARGRAVLVVGGLLAAAWVLGPSGAFAGSPADAQPLSAVTVGPGDTLWGIAQSIARPDQDVRDIVDEIAQLNGLDGARLIAGEQLLVPVPASD